MSRADLGKFVALLTWLGALLLTVRLSERGPTPLPATSPAHEFSALRARTHLDALAGAIGRRVGGSTESATARAYVISRMKSLPQWETSAQRVSSFRLTGDHARIYDLTNVVAVLPGRRKEALLVSSHYDSSISGPGAGDDAASVAAMLETARALAQQPQLEQTLIFLFNESEELGLHGAHGFTRHPLLSSVRAFLNLESAGPSGKPILFQSGPGNPWLAKAYAHAAPHPHGSVLAQDIFQSGAIPSDTDFRVFRDDGNLRGIDTALYRNGYLYHTPSDEASRVTSTTLQAIGANTLALCQHIGSMPHFPARDDKSASVYYDFLGLTMLSYSIGTARILAVLMLLSVIIAIFLACRSRKPHLSALLSETALRIITIPLSIACVAGAGFLLFALTGRHHTWFDDPVAIGMSSSMLGFGLALLMRRKRPDTLTESAASLLTWSLLLLLLTAAGIGAGYLALWWTGALIAVLLVTVRAGSDATNYAGWILILPPALMTVQLGEMLLAMFIPVSGRMLLAISFDTIIPALAAIPAVLLAISIPKVKPFRMIATILALAGFAGMVYLATTARYSGDRPMRLSVVEERAEGVAPILRLRGSDYPTTRTNLLASYFPFALRDGSDYAVALSRNSKPGRSEEIRTELNRDGFSLTYRPGHAFSTRFEFSAPRTLVCLSCDRQTPLLVSTFSLHGSNRSQFRLAVRRGARPASLEIDSATMGVSEEARMLTSRLPASIAVTSVTHYLRTIVVP